MASEYQKRLNSSCFVPQEYIYRGTKQSDMEDRQYLRKLKTFKSILMEVINDKNNQLETKTK